MQYWLITFSNLRANNHIILKNFKPKAIEFSTCIMIFNFWFLMFSKNIIYSFKIFIFKVNWSFHNGINLNRDYDTLSKNGCISNLCFNFILFISFSKAFIPDFFWSIYPLIAIAWTFYCKVGKALIAISTFYAKSY